MNTQNDENRGAGTAQNRASELPVNLPDTLNCQDKLPNTRENTPISRAEDGVKVKTGEGLRTWLREFFNPPLKCGRVGHDLREREYRVYVYPPIGDWAVADRVWMKQPTCRRCRHAEPESEISRTALTGLSMPVEAWDKLKRDGRHPA